MPLDSLGLKIGHATDKANYTGCTVFLCPPDTVASVEVRGGGPGSREAALMQPTRPDKHPNAILFAGGSALGLGAAEGVVQWHVERGMGYQTPIRPIPLVPTSILFDLFFNKGAVIPSAEMAYAACENAILNNAAQGNVGAGTGAIVGKWNGFPGPMKGGFGVAGDRVGEVAVFAAAAVNAMGDVLDTDGTVLAGARRSDGQWAVADNLYRHFRHYDIPGMEMINTTLVLVATNVRLSKIECFLLAQRAHDGLAQAIRPVHSTHDGDTVYGVSTGNIEAHLEAVANMGVELTAQAIRNAVRHARTVGDIYGLGE
ncbi:MAG: P1 family peptidase [Anaerolineae bacterium]|nr:P1 family peptidase [Anaerolineae bacterium]